MTDPRAHTAERFAELSGNPATHMAYAPGRVNLIGEHTDYNGGFVLPFAIDRGIFIAARPRVDALVHIWSEQFPSEMAEVDLSQPLLPGEPAWSNYARGVIAGILASGARVPGFDALIHSTLPTGGGVSSSAALEVATATLCESLSSTQLDPVSKALLCQKAEHEFAGTPCGIMDQFAVTLAHAGHLLLIDCQSHQTRQVAMPGDEVSLLVINTMVKHELNDGDYRARRDDCHEAARLLGVPDLRSATMEILVAHPELPGRLTRHARHVITENTRTLAAVDALRARDWSSLGELLYASHESLRDDFEVSCAELDIVMEAARAIGTAGGVYGCRMTGGGFGGCCVALVRSESADQIAREVSEAYRAKTCIEPACFVTRPSDGASILLQP